MRLIANGLVSGAIYMNRTKVNKSGDFGRVVFRQQGQKVLVHMTLVLHTLYHSGNLPVCYYVKLLYSLKWCTRDIIFPLHILS